SAAFEFQNVDKHPQQNVEDVIQRFYRGDGAAATLSRTHLAGHLLELKALALQYHQRLDFRIFQGKTTGENLQGLAVDADKARRRITHRLSQDGAKHQAKEPNPDGADGVGITAVAILETRT